MLSKAEPTGTTDEFFQGIPCKYKCMIINMMAITIATGLSYIIFKINPAMATKVESIGKFRGSIIIINAAM